MGRWLYRGHNYRQGSSREHATLAPLHLGIRAGIARSFVRIHHRNLISQGILPLVFADEADYDRAEQEDGWKIEGARRAVESGDTTLFASTGSGEEITLEARLLARGREVLLAGGTLKHFRREDHGT